MTYIIDTYPIIRVWNPEFIENNGKWIVIANTEIHDSGGVSCYMKDADHNWFGEFEESKTMESRGIVIVAGSEHDAKHAWVFLRNCVNDPT
jgi:hypothetical protein